MIFSSQIDLIKKKYIKKMEGLYDDIFFLICDNLVTPEINIFSQTCKEIYKQTERYFKHVYIQMIKKRSFRHLFNGALTSNKTIMFMRTNGNRF